MKTNNRAAGLTALSILVSFFTLANNAHAASLPGPSQQMVCVYDSLSVRATASGAVQFTAAPYEVVTPVAGVASVSAVIDGSTFQMEEVTFPNRAGQPQGWVDADYVTTPDLCPTAPSEITNVPSQYAYVDPTHLVPQDLLAGALNYYAANLSQITNSAYLGVINFGAYSGDARFFIINMKTGAVWAIHVAHGIGSDPNYTGDAQVFSNTPNSDMTSLGVYQTGAQYDGEHGLSMLLNGLSPTNSQVAAREIVLHQADYVSEDGSIVGRSDGCFALASTTISQVLQELDTGAIIYAGVSAGSKYVWPVQ